MCVISGTGRVAIRLDPLCFALLRCVLFCFVKVLMLFSIQFNSIQFNSIQTMDTIINTAPLPYQLLGPGADYIVLYCIVLECYWFLAPESL